MLGKEKCRILREIRQKIAEENDIELVTSECTYQGECRGTCPKCEAELRHLEAELEKRRNSCKRIALAGVSVGMAMSMTACAAVDFVENLFFTPTPEIEVLDGEIDSQIMGDFNLIDCPEDEPVE